MKQTVFKAIFNGLRALKVLTVMLSSVSLSLSAWVLGTHPSHAIPSSPLLTNTQQSQESVARMVAAIRSAAGGSVTGANAQAAISQVIAANPGASMQSIVAAVNALGLSDAALSEAISAIASSFNATSESVTSAVITDAYMSGGKSVADARIADLRDAVGDGIVDSAMESAQATMNNLSPEQLNLIQTAAGDDAGGDTSDVYNG